FVVNRIKTTAADFTYGNLDQSLDNTIQPVTIDPGPGVGEDSSVLYTGVSPTYYPQSSNPPQIPGSFKITFNTAQTDTHTAETGLEAPGKLVVKAKTPDPAPTASKTDMTYTNFEQYAGKVTEVSIIHTSDGGPAINIRYNDELTIPQTAGSYTVTFDVAPGVSHDHLGTTGLIAPDPLIVSLNPTTNADFTYGHFTDQTADAVTGVIITPKSGMVGTVSNITYGSSPTPPQTAGSYTVTFDAAATDYYEAAPSLTAPSPFIVAALEAIVLTGFTGNDAVVANEAAYVNNAWDFTGNPGQAGFDIGSRITRNGYSKVLIEGSSSGPFTVELSIDGITPTQTETPVQFTSGRLEILLDPGVVANRVTFENIENGGDIIITSELLDLVDRTQLSSMGLLDSLLKLVSDLVSGLVGIITGIFTSEEDKIQQLLDSLLGQVLTPELAAALNLDINDPRLTQFRVGSPLQLTITKVTFMP
ncbi:MAG: hypothetical protein LBU99_04260, partial [Spirochaetaceae bacterium]|nr:hypothetical protein [Spirochaetaceae bacterium]